MNTPPLEVLNAWADFDSPVITLLELTPEGRKTRQVRSELSCFLRTEDMTPDLARALREARNVGGVQAEGEWQRILWRNSDGRKIACSEEGWFHKQGIPTFEGDVQPIKRWLADNDVHVAKPRLCYLDLETDGRVLLAHKEKMRILSFAVMGEDGKKYVQALEEDSDKAEAHLLGQLWAVLGSYDQVAAWNGDRFDFPVLWARSKDRRLQVDARRWLWLDHLELYRRMNISASESGDEKQSLALAAVAISLKLPLGKIEGFDPKKIFTSWQEGGDARKRLLDYNLRDAEVMAAIEKKTGYIQLLYTLCEACRCFPDSQGISPMTQMDGFMLRLSRERSYHFPSRDREALARSHWAQEVEGTGGFRGAFVMEPTTRGIAREVHVGDFASMYPNIILSWNMSPETVRDPPEDAPVMPHYLKHIAKPAAPQRPTDVCEAAITGCWFVNEPRGIMCVALDEMLRLRKEWNEKKAALPPGTVEWVEADRRATAYKIAANSFFGVCGSPVSRFFDKRVAESITQCGAWLIHQTIKKAQAEGLTVIYADTDSIFVMGCSSAVFADFVARCNKDLYPALLVAMGATRNNNKLAYEKAFDRLIFVSAKRYIGRYSHYKGKPAAQDSKPEVKGLEYKRGDSVKLARLFQAQVVDLLMGGGILRPRGDHCEEDPRQFEGVVEAMLERVLRGQLDLADVLQSKRLSRPVSHYNPRKKKDGSDSSELPHIRVARALEKAGEDIGQGSKIDYFVANGLAQPVDVRPASEWAGECDRYALWEDAVWPPTYRLLQAAFPATIWSKYNKMRPQSVKVRTAAGTRLRTIKGTPPGQGTLDLK